MKKLFNLLLGLGFFFPILTHGQIPVTVLNKATNYAINLDSLARTGTSKVMPNGWHLYQSDGRTTYRANIGDSANAGVYSYGAANGGQSRIRALGSISSSTDTAYFGAEFVNNTGFPLSSILISYTVEQWRLGSLKGPDTTEFDFSTSASGLKSNSSKWTHISGLDMISPVTSGTVGPLNGANALNQSKLSYTIKGLNIAAGAHFWFRWYDHVLKANNDGLGLQALAITPYSIIAGPTVVTTIAPAKVAQPTTPGIPDTTVYGKFKGIVLSPNFQAASTGNIQFSLRDATGAITCISTGKNFGYSVNIGDSLYITGKIRSYRYLAYVQIDTLKVLQANKVANPAFVTANAVNEQNESNLIKLSNVSLTATAVWDTTGSSVLGGFTTTARGALGNITIFINKNSNLFLKKKPNFPFNITGIDLQSSSTANAGYFIWPRFIKDLDTLPQPFVATRTIGQINTFRANPGPNYGRADSANKKFFVKGVVHSPNLFYSGTYFNLIDNTGAITVYNITPISGYNAKIGDSVLVRGTIIQQGGLIMLAPDSIKLLSTGASLTTPKTIAAAPITKSMESYLLKLKNMKLVDASLWDSTNAKTYNMFEVRITNGKDTFFMDIAKTTDLFRISPKAGLFNITGVVGENSTNPLIPFNDHYLIIPRGSFDIQPVSLPIYKISQVKGFNATTGVPDSAGVNCILKGVVQSGVLTDTGIIAYAIADNTGAITVAHVNKTLLYTPTIGDSIFVEGSVGQSNGLTYFGADSTLTVNTGNKIISPVVLPKLDEKDESALITKQGYVMWNPNQWDNISPANKYGFNVQFVRGTDTVLVHISKNVPDLFNLPYNSKPTGKVDITGIELQKTTVKAPFSNYYLEPRQLTDISANSGIETIINDQNGISMYPNPAHTNLTINSQSYISSIKITDLLGNQILNVNEPESVSITINVAELKAGIYIMNVKNQNGYLIQKFIKQ